MREAFMWCLEDCREVQSFRRAGIKHGTDDLPSQHMLEGSAEPAFCSVFTLDNAEQCSAAMRAAGRFVLVNREVCELIEEIQALCNG